MVLWSSVALAATLTVPGQFPTIQGALTASNHGDIIEIDAGTYDESLLVRTGVTLRGAGPGVTVIQPSNNPFAAVWVILPNLSVTVEGMLIDGGEVSHGVYVENVGVDLTLKDLDFVGGREALPGGSGGTGVLTYGADVQIFDSTFTDSIVSEGDGGHVRVEGGTLLIDGCQLDNATVIGIPQSQWGGSGGAVSVTFGTLIVRNSSFTNNVAGGAGGAIKANGLIVEDSVFVANSSGHGGAIQQDGAGDAVVRNSHFSDGIATVEGGAMNLHDLPSVLLEDNVFENNEAPFSAALDLSENLDAQVNRNLFTGNNAYYGAANTVWSGNASFAGNQYCDNSRNALEITKSWPMDLAVSVSHDQMFRNGHSEAAGGAIMIWGPAEVDLSHLTIADNLSSSDSGAIHVLSATATLEESVISESNAAGVYVVIGANFDESYNLWWENTADVTQPSGIDDTDVAGVDPMYMDLGEGCFADLRPQKGSPLIDAGRPPNLDADGSPSDIGAFGGTDAVLYVDLDADGVISDDCGPWDPQIFPGATEIAGDNLDQDCDGLDLCYIDADGDGIGIADVVAGPLGCADVGMSASDADCDDNDPEIFPGAVEIPDDGTDQDCNGEDLTSAVPQTDTNDETPGGAGAGSNLPAQWFCQQGGGFVPHWALGLVVLGICGRRRSNAD